MTQGVCKLLKESKDPRIRHGAAVTLGRIGANSELAVPALRLLSPSNGAEVVVARVLQKHLMQAKVFPQ